MRKSKSVNLIRKLENAHRENGARFCFGQSKLYRVFVVSYERDVEYEVFSRKEVEQRHQYSRDDFDPPYVAGK